MDQFLSILLGVAASRLQSDRFKDLDSRLRYAISFGACIVAGLVSTFFVQFSEGGEFDFHEVLANLGLSLAASQVFYNTYFKKFLSEK